MARLRTSQSPCQDAVHLAIHNQADMATGDLLIVSLRVNARAPVNELIPFREDRGKADPLRKRRERTPTEAARTLRASTHRGSVTALSPYCQEGTKYQWNERVNVECIVDDGRAESDGVANLLREVHDQEACQHAPKAVAYHNNRTLRLPGDIVEPPA